MTKNMQNKIYICIYMCIYAFFENVFLSKHALTFKGTGILYG